MTAKSLDRSIARAFLVELRRRAGLTQRQFAARAGCRASWIAKLEAGDRYLRLSDVQPIARALRISRSEVLRLYGLKSRELDANGRPVRHDHPTKRPGKSTSAWLVLLASYRKWGDS
jgi:transcriptional regulator with XRE-family HTH domain